MYPVVWFCLCAREIRIYATGFCCIVVDTLVPLAQNGICPLAGSQHKANAPYNPLKVLVERSSKIKAMCHSHTDFCTKQTLLNVPAHAGSVKVAGLAHQRDRLIRIPFNFKSRLRLLPLLRQTFDLLSYTVSPINSSSHLCLDDAFTPECNILHADTKQMAWFAFQVVQTRCHSPFCNGRSCTVSIYIVCFALLLFCFCLFGSFFFLLCLLFFEYKV